MKRSQEDKVDGEGVSVKTFNLKNYMQLPLGFK